MKKLLEELRQEQMGTDNYFQIVTGIVSLIPGCLYSNFLRQRFNVAYFQHLFAIANGSSIDHGSAYFLHRQHIFGRDQLNDFTDPFVDAFPVFLAMAEGRKRKRPIGSKKLYCFFFNSIIFSKYSASTMSLLRPVAFLFCNKLLI